MEGKEVPAITELRGVVRELSQKLRLMAKASRLDALGAMDHLWKSNARLGKALELSNKSVGDVQDELGGVTELQAKHNLYGVTKGVVLALTSRLWAEELLALGDRVSEVEKLLTEVNKDHQAAECYLFRKLTLVAPSSGGLTPSPGAVPPLSTSMTILDEQGNQCCMLGDLV
jgi:hypothetical protein